MPMRSAQKTVTLAFFSTLVIALLWLTFSSTAPSQGASPPVVMSVDASVVHQKIDGFGTSFGGFGSFERGHFDETIPQGIAYKMSPELRATLIRTAIAELGVSHLRLWLSPTNIEKKNDNDDPHAFNWNAFTWEGDSRLPQAQDFRDNRRNGVVEIAEFLQAAAPLGLEHWILTPGRLPEWLDEMFKTDYPNRFDEYAEWAAAHQLYLKRKLGREGRHWSMFNEPDVKKWKAPELWIPWITATGRRFRKEGLTTTIMFPDNAGVFDAVEMVKGVMKDPEARKHMGALAYHHYRSSGRGPQPFITLAASPREENDLFKKVTSGIRDMAELGRQFGLPSWQTETAYYPQFTKDLSEWEVGMGRAYEVHLELTHGASAVEAMSLLAPDVIDSRYDATIRREGHHILLRSDGQQVTYWQVTKDTGAVLAQWARFVRPGDVRIGATTSDPMLPVTAFASEKNRRYVAVVINNTPDARNVEFKLQNLSWKPRQMSVFRSDALHILDSFPMPEMTSADRYGLMLPPRSLSTIIWSQEPVPPARFRRSGNVSGLSPSYEYDHKRFNELRSKLRRGARVIADEQAYVDWANAWVEERNELHLKTNPPRESTGLVPLTELGARKYKGQEGGLYPGGKNTPPARHLDAGLRLAREVAPRDGDGRLAENGKIVLLSIGMSNATMEFQVFKRIADADPEKNQRLVIVDGAQGGQTAEITADPSTEFWKVVDERLARAGAAAAQVQVVWMKQATPLPTRPFQEEAKRLQGLLATTLHVLQRRFPNLKIAYLSSRTYSGFAEIALSPEPRAYESAFAMKWLIADQIAGKPDLNYDPAAGVVRSPWLAWGPYLWADGKRPRADGLSYVRADFAGDGIHPMKTGTEKVSGLLLAFLKTDPTARTWFLGNAVAR